MKGIELSAAQIDVLMKAIMEAKLIVSSARYVEPWVEKSGNLEMLKEVRGMARRAVSVERRLSRLAKVPPCCR